MQRWNQSSSHNHLRLPLTDLTEVKKVRFTTAWRSIRKEADPKQSWHQPTILPDNYFTAVSTGKCLRPLLENVLGISKCKCRQQQTQSPFKYEYTVYTNNIFLKI